MLQLKRAYEPAAKSDGKRILVDRLWPRGVTRKQAAIDEWAKEVAPSPELRRWFGHDSRRWLEFKDRYVKELRTRAAVLRELAALAMYRRVTLIYAAHDERRNNAVVLAAAIRRRMNRHRRHRA